MAYGGPDSLDDVEPYLLDVRGGRPTPPELVEEVRARYAAIGGKSPLLEITCRQAQALESALNACGAGAAEPAYRVFVGMRHWHPTIRETIAQISQAGITSLVAMCMTPFSSRMSTGAYYEQLDRAIEAQEANPVWREALSQRRIGAWYTHPTFVHALAEYVRSALSGFPARAGAVPAVVFSAHSLPASLIEQGDPYAAQFEALARLVAHAAGLTGEQWRTCFQSAGAQSTRWLGPSLKETLLALASEGTKDVLVAPIGFLSDHVEVLYDIDIEARRTGEEAGLILRRTASLNDQPHFIQALKNIIQEEENKDHD
jgi:ferrochelatase